jgi:hypothetical protein
MVKKRVRKEYVVISRRIRSARTVRCDVLVMKGLPVALVALSAGETLIQRLTPPIIASTGKICSVAVRAEM